MDTVKPAAATEPAWLKSLQSLSLNQPEAAPAVKRHAEPGDNPTPPVPSALSETGLPDAIIEQLILKQLYFKGEIVGRELARLIGLKFSLIEATLDLFRRNQWIAMKRSLGMGNVSAVYTLSEMGRSIAREHLAQNSYSGVAPVPIDQYREMVRAQTYGDDWLTKEMLADAFKHMVVSDTILSQLGPAVNAGKSFLIYGQPGNGKTYVAEALFKVQSTPIFIPYAIEVQGQIIQVFDPIHHHPVEEEDADASLSALAVAVSDDFPYDRRWIKCKRPFIVTGGELTLSMLDLSYNEGSKIYDAPFQLKANNGIYLIDDFGRQKVTPAEVLNRWIVPMERRIDYLTFQTGGKVSVPFETFLVFSTNLNPESLGDEAFLRRIQYKMLLRSPDEEEFKEIFDRYCAQEKVPCPEDVLERFIANHYRDTGKRMRRCHPRDVISHAIDIIKFERMPYELNDWVLATAFESCFTTEDHHED